MRRVIVVAHTVMTLISGVYYCASVKKIDKSIKTILIWRNPTQYHISVNAFKKYCDEIYIVPINLDGRRILPSECIQGYTANHRQLKQLGIMKMIHENVEKELLLVGSDYNGMMNNLINEFSKNKSKKRVILYEEGMALYNDYQYSIKDYIDYKLGKEINMQPVIGKSKKIDVIFAQHPNELPGWKKKNRRVLRQGDIFSKPEIWDGLIKKDTSLLNMFNKLNEKKIILYLGQPIQEFKTNFALKEEIRFIENLADGIPDEYVLLIKKHPRDRMQKYRDLSKNKNCIIFENKAGWYPIECLLGYMDVKHVVTLSSSAALNILDRVQECDAVYTYNYFNVPIAQAWNEMYRKYRDRLCNSNKMDDIKKYIVTERENQKSMKVQVGKDVAYMKKFMK